MKKVSLIALTALNIMSSPTIHAGSMGPVAIQNNWTGFYTGLNAGYGWSSANTDILPLPAGGGSFLPYTLPVSMSGGELGAQAGFNWQIGGFSPWVVGLETDIQWSPLSGSAAGRAISIAPSSEVIYNTLTTKQSTQWFGTVRPRLGYLITESTLLYGTAGFAYGNMNESANTYFITNTYGNENYPASSNAVKYGWTAGAGLEWSPMQHWSVKLEYLYEDLGSVSKIGNPTTTNPIYQTKYTWTNPPQWIRLGVNYRF